MKLSFPVLLCLLAASMLLASCTDETIGGSLNDTRSAVIADSSFVISGHSVRNSHLRSRSSVQLLGKVSSDGYGTLMSDVVTQFMPATSIDTAGVTVDMIDSCKLTMRITPGDFTGDSLAPMRMGVHRLIKSLPDPIYSDFNPAGYYDAQPLGTEVYSAKSMDTVTDYYTSKKYLQASVKLPVGIAKEIFNKYKQSPETFSTPQAFEKFFHGMYITNTYGEGHVMNFHDIELNVYYRKHYKDEDTDTIYPAMRQAYMAVTPEVLYNNNINLSVAPSVLGLVEAGEPIVMGPAGYEVEVEFPINEVIAKYREGSSKGMSVINMLSLEIPAERVANEWGIEPPEYLLLVKKSERDKFFERDSLTDEKNSFYAKYDAGKHTYTFAGMRDYLLDIIKNKGGTPAAEDLCFSIMPIDVTTYSNSSGYYYTSSVSSSVVTKIAPCVSRPCIAKLLLPKAKIKLVFSRQSI